MWRRGEMLARYADQLHQEIDEEPYPAFVKRWLHRYIRRQERRYGHRIRAEGVHALDDRGTVARWSRALRVGIVVTAILAVVSIGWILAILMLSIALT